MGTAGQPAAKQNPDVKTDGLGHQGKWLFPAQHESETLKPAWFCCLATNITDTLTRSHSLQNKLELSFKMSA